MKRKIVVLTVPLLLAVTLCLFASTASAGFAPSFVGVGSAFLCGGGLGINMGQAVIAINYPINASWDGHSIGLSNRVWISDIFSRWGYFWNITQIAILPNYNLLVRAVPLTINAYDKATLFQPGPCNITILISPPITNPKSVHFEESSINLTPVYALSLKVAYFYGWGMSVI